jgi:hypothetical protein
MVVGFHMIESPTDYGLNDEKAAGLSNALEMVVQGIRARRMREEDCGRQNGCAPWLVTVARPPSPLRRVSGGSGICIIQPNTELNVTFAATECGALQHARTINALVRFVVARLRV